MKVDEETVRKVARLARIRITDDEAKALQGDMTAILDWVEQLDEVDTSTVEPMTGGAELSAKLRADVVDDGSIADDIVANAPAQEDHYFMVPKVVE